MTTASFTVEMSRNNKAIRERENFLLFGWFN